jgi:hypothetical protein
MEDGMERKNLEMEKFVKLLSKREKSMSFRLNPVLKELFEKTCQEEDITPSDCLNYLIIKYLQEKGRL